MRDTNFHVSVCSCSDMAVRVAKAKMFIDDALGADDNYSDTTFGGAPQEKELYFGLRIQAVVLVSAGPTGRSPSRRVWPCSRWADW